MALGKSWRVIFGLHLIISDTTFFKDVRLYPDKFSIATFNGTGVSRNEAADLSKFNRNPAGAAFQCSAGMRTNFHPANQSSCRPPAWTPLPTPIDTCLDVTRLVLS